MNHPKDTALIAPFRNVETTVKTLAADSAVSTERALNAAIVSADITRGYRQDGEALSFDDLRIAAPRDPDSVKPS